MSAMKPLLIELGVEELPVKALPELARAFFDGVIAALEKRGIAFDGTGAKPLYTPRRLAVLLPGVAEEQPEQKSEMLGPYLNVALDADGKPTRALEGFAAKAGVAWTALEKTSDSKGERFIFRAVKAGGKTAALLPGILSEAIAAIPVGKPMRWGDHDYAFARPVLWLVLLFGEAVVDAEAFGTKADRMSQGHRFEHGKAVWLSAPGDYVETLRAAKVLADPDERRASIVEQVNTAAKAAGGDARITDDNLEQVVCLTEWPNAIACGFERDFLAVPQEALIATMEANQKFFPVLDAQGKLTEHFIGVANIQSRDPEQVRKGYERVIRPRFADAKFFFDEDLKQGLSAMNAGLTTVTYQQKLGSVADKAERIAKLAESIAPALGVDAALARRAASLSKADLQSRLVNEFPELQGISGRHYAAADAQLADLSAQDRAALASSLDEIYAPRFAGDDIAASSLGKVLAIAERLDTLAGGFAAGLKPTGNKDPFALRRNALGLARTIIESGVGVSLPALLDAAVLLAQADIAHSGKVEAQPNLSGELYDFILDRLRGYYEAKSIPATHFNAVAELKPASLADFDRRLDAIGQFAALPEAESLAAANKRIRNILRKVEGEVPSDIDAALLKEPAEAALAQAVQAAISDTSRALASGDYVAVLKRLSQLRGPVDAFFDAVMVMAENPALRNNRLALLKSLSDRFLAVADISLLAQ